MPGGAGIHPVRAMWPEARAVLMIGVIASDVTFGHPEVTGERQRTWDASNQ
jgi:hypothetical protein